jgi:hypothetical protein
MQEVLGYLLGACEVECPKDFIRLYCKWIDMQKFEGLKILKICILKTHLI